MEDEQKNEVIERANEIIRLCRIAVETECKKCEKKKKYEQIVITIGLEFANNNDMSASEIVRRIKNIIAN